MIKFLKKTFALSDKGAKDLHKAIWCCAANYISLMLPMSVIFMILNEFVDTLENGSILSPNIGIYILLSLIIVALIFITERMQYNATFLASYEESANMRISISEHLRKLPMSFFGKRDLSDLTTTIMSDCAGIEQTFSHYVPQIIGAFISLIPVFIGLFSVNWRMGIAVTWVIPVSLIIAFLSKRIQDYYKRKLNAVKLSATDNIQECIENIKDIKASNQSDVYMAALDEKLSNQERRMIISELATGVSVTSAQMLLKLGLGTTIVTGAGLILSGSINFITLLLFLIAASRIYDPLYICYMHLAAIFDTLLKAERINQIREHSVQTGTENATSKGYDVEFKNVGFEYNTGETVLDNVSFTAKQGEVTALVGPSGGGKSTAAKLAARFWDANKGSITLGGTDISTVDPESYLENISIVFQDVVLFNNTIMENIRIGRKSASDEEVKKAAKLANCHEFIMQLPDGYETIIGENGSTISGGERQRLSIARALLKDSPVILLDEATASLDVENETQIQAAISRLVENKTVLIIAHRMRTVAGSDKVVVLKDGNVAEQGTPDELWNQKGIYRHMAELQLQSQGWSIR